MRKVFLCISVILMLQSASFAIANSLVDAVQKKYDTLNAMHSDFEQILIHKESGTKEERKGTLIFKKPLLVRWETTNPSSELLIVNEKEIWDYFADEDLAYKYSADVVEDSSSIIRVLTGQAKIKQDFEIEENGTEDGLVKLTLYPKNPTQSLVEAEILADPNTKLIRRVRVFDFYGNENDIKFTRQDTEAKVDTKIFYFVPPNTAEVEDRTKSNNVNVPLLK